MSPPQMFLSRKPRPLILSWMNFLRRLILRRSRCRFLIRSLSWSAAVCRPCRCPGRRSRGRGSGEDRVPILRSTTDHAIRRTSLHTIRRTIRYSTKGPGTMGRTIRCNTTDCPISRNIHNTKGRSATVSTNHHSTKDSRPNRLTCRKDGSRNTMTSRTKAGRLPRCPIHCRKGKRMWCC